MDRNSIIGIVLIFAILVVFSIMNQPSKEEIEATKRKRDSIAQVEAEKARLQQEIQEKEPSDTSFEADTVLLANDTVSQSQQIQEKIDQFGVFGSAAIGTEELYTVENNLMRLIFSNKGGRIVSVELKNYQTHDSLPLILFDGPETRFGLNFFAQNRSIQTEQLFFEASTSNKQIIIDGPEVRKGNEGRIKFNEENPGGSESIAFKLEVTPGRFMEFVYTLSHNSFLVDFDLNLNGMEQYIADNLSYLNFTWSYDVPRQERISKFGEDRYTNINYKFFEDEVDNLAQNKSDEDNLSTKVKWIGFKQLFFNSTITLLFLALFNASKGLDVSILI